MPNREPIYGLVCAGGGAHGAYQVGVLKYVHEHFCNGRSSPFQVFSGTSAGSLNTGFYATRSHDALDSRLELERMWLNFHVEEYHGNVLKNAVAALVKEWVKPKALRKPMWSLLDPDPLMQVVAHGFQRAHLARSIEAETTLGLAVSATELQSSRLVWFQEGPAAAPWSSIGSTAKMTPLGVPHIQASCSVPVVFPPVLIDGHYYLDGGVANKTPFTPVLNMEATRILSIATDQPLPGALPEPSPEFKPSLAATIRMLVDQLSHDFAVNQAIGIDMINYFHDRSPGDNPADDKDHLLLGDTLDLAKYKRAEIELFTPSRRIRATDIFDPELFESDLDSKSTSLAFHRDFIGPLIDLGYEDGRTRHDELAEFFRRDRPQRPSRFALATTSVPIGCGVSSRR